MTDNDEKQSWEEVKRELGEENFKVFVGTEAEKLTDDLDNKKQNPIQLPPKPEGILPWSEEEEKAYKYTLSNLLEKSINKRQQFKLFNLWNLWGMYRNNETLIELLNKVPEDKTGSEFILKCGLVLLIDKLGKILNGDTDILEEMMYVSPDDVSPGQPSSR